MTKTNEITLTDDTLKNIFLMAPHLDEVGQNRVFGLICGLVQGKREHAETDKNVKAG